MDSTDNSFDKLWYCFSSSMTMEQLLEFALTSKVILSYEIDYLNSFHDRLMQGLWKRSSNGCFYKMDDRHEKLAYIILNENYEAEVEKSLEKFRKMSNSIVAQKVFDETPESESCILQQGEVVCDADQVFDEVSEPNPSLSNNQTVSYTLKNTQRLKNGGIQADDNEICVSDSCILQKGEVVSGVEQVFDEIPEPHFYPNQVQVTSINGEDTQNPTEVESIQGGYELEPAIQKFQSDHFTHKQLCAKLCTLEGSHLWDFVIIYANRMRFSTILKSLFNGCHLSDKMPHKVDDSYGNSYSECPCSRVSAKSFVMLNADHSSKCIENVVSPLLLSDIDRFTGSCISMILGVNVYKPKVFELEYDWRSHSNFKEVNSWDKRLNCIDYGMIESTILPLNDGGQILMELMLIRRWYMLDICGGGSVSVTLVNGILVAIFQLNVNPCTTWISIPYDPGILVTNLSPMVFTYTLEDKGVFRGEEGINREYTSLVLKLVVSWSNYNASTMRKSVVFLTCVFDPGGLWDALLRSSWCSNPNLGFCMNYLSVCVLDELGNCNTWWPLLPNMSFSRKMSMINAFSLGHEMVLNIRYDSPKLLLTSYLEGVWYLTFHRGSCDETKVLSAHVGVPSLIIAHIVSKSAAIIALTSFFIKPSDIGIPPTPLEFIVSFVFHYMFWSEGNKTRAYYYGGWVISDMNVVGNIRIMLLLDGSSFHLLKENLKVAIKCLIKKEVVTIFIFYPGINKSRIVDKRSVVGRCFVGIASDLVLVYAEIFICPKIYSSRQGYEAARWNLFGRVVFIIEKRAYTIEETKEVMSKEDRFLAHTTGGRKHVVDHISISSHALMVITVNSFAFDPGGVKYELHCSVLYVSSVIFYAFNPGGNGDLSEVANATRAEFVPLKIRQATLMEATNAIPVMLIFDPGGGVVRLKMTNRVKTCQYGGGKQLEDKRNEDPRIYVFDPGGLLMRFVMKAMVMSSQPGMYCATSCFKYRLSLILEDKDRFKRRVLIHIKNKTKGSLVIYPSCFLFPKAYSLYKGIIKL